MNTLMPYMVATGPQTHITESYVSSPPALVIVDERGTIWTLGVEVAPPQQSPNGEYAFPIMRDGRPVGEIASRIERRNGKVRIFTRTGWKRWTGTQFV